MRELLSKHPVLRLIHKDASDFFRAKATATEDPLERAQYDRNTVYHEFQWQTSETAISNWQILVAERLGKEDFLSAFGLAEEVCLEEYARQLDQPQLACALSMQCLIALDLVDVCDDEDPREEKLQAAKRALASLQTQFPDCTGKLVLLDAMRAVRESFDPQILHLACTNLAAKNPENQWSLQACLPFDVFPNLKRSLAIGRNRLGDRRCVADFAQLVNNRPPPLDLEANPLSLFLLKSLADCLRSYGDPGSGLEVFAAFLAACEASGPAPARLAEIAAGILNDFMRFEAAAGFAGKSPNPNALSEFNLLLLQALARNFPAKALQQLQRFDRATDQTRGQAEGEAAIFASCCSALLCDTSATTTYLENAASLFMAVGRYDKAAYCHSQTAAFWMHHHGNFAKTREALERRSRSVVSIRDIQNIDQRLAFEMKIRTGSLSEVKTIDVAPLIKSATLAPYCYGRINVAITLLAVLRGESLRQHADELATLLIEAFEYLPDAIARSAYPWLLRDRRVRVSLDPGLEQRLVNLFVVGDDPPLLLDREAGPSDRAWACLTHAQLLRFIDRDKEAKTMTQAARSYFTGIGSLVGLREVWHISALSLWEQAQPDELGLFKEEHPGLCSVIAIEQAELALQRGDKVVADQWLQQIDLEQVRHQPSHFAPRALLVAAMLGTDGLKVGNLIREAEAAYRNLDDPRGIRRCRFWLSRVATRSAAGQAAPSPQTLFRWLPYPCRRMVLKRDTSHLELDEHVIAELDRPFRDSLNQLLSETMSCGESRIRKVEVLQWENEVAPHALMEAMMKAPDFFAGPFVSNLLKPKVGMAWYEAGSRDIVIASDHLFKAAFPWELARFNHPLWNELELGLMYRAVRAEDYPRRWLQQGLGLSTSDGLPVDGIIGPMTVAEARAFMHLHGANDLASLKALMRKEFSMKRTSAPTVVILQSTQEQQVLSRRGFADVSLLPKIYKSVGFRCSVYDGLSLDAYLSQHMGSAAPSVIHIYAPYVEERSTGDVSPNFGKHYANNAHSRVSQTSSLYQIPLLILDGPSEPDPAEQMRQIFLRNAVGTLYAQRLDCPNILALGLASHLFSDILLELLVEVMQGSNLREIYSTLTKASPAHSYEDLPLLLHKHTGTVAPALWTADPDLSILL
jgi:hypothetical protein